MADNNSDRIERLQIMLSQEELAAVDTWRFSRQMPSRAAAVRELLRLGIKALGLNTATGGEHSNTYGVIKGGLTDKED